MNTEDRKLLLEKAPEQGWILIYSRQGVSFCRYQNKADAETQLIEEQMLEAHLFDETKEARAIISRNTSEICTSGPAPSRWIVTAIMDNGMDTLNDQYLLDDRFLDSSIGRKLTVISYIDFNENDQAFIKDYRLAGIGYTDAE